MLNLKKKTEGFTIIEVMIVLAIAGLILLIVFLAVPALQRNSRNTQRRNDASHMGGLLNEFASNNNGTFPTAVAAGTGSTATTLYLGSDKFAIMSTTVPIATCTATTCAANTTADTLTIKLNANCNGAASTATGGLAYDASPRSAAVSYLVEQAGAAVSGLPAGSVSVCTSV